MNMQQDVKLEEITLVKNVISNPDEQRHFIKIYKHKKPIEIVWREKIIASAEQYLSVREIGSEFYPERYYIPIESIGVKLEVNGRTSYCPIKGVAQYFDINDNGEKSELAWVYTKPLEESRILSGHFSFHLEKVSIKI